MSEYPGIPGIFQPAQDHPGMDRAYLLPYWGILGFSGYFDHPLIILGWTKLTLPYRGILGFPGYFDHPGMDTVHPPTPVGVSWDSQDTPTSPGWTRNPFIFTHLVLIHECVNHLHVHVYTCRSFSIPPEQDDMTLKCRMEKDCHTRLNHCTAGMVLYTQSIHLAH